MVYSSMLGGDHIITCSTTASFVGYDLFGTADCTIIMSVKGKQVYCMIFLTRMDHPLGLRLEQK